MGTPLYLAPEAVRAPDAVDARADVYAIGAVAYFMLAGSAPFNGSTAVEICMKHVSTPPQPLGERAGRIFDAELERLVMDCLAKPPEERPASAEALLERLEALRANKNWTQRDARQAWEAFQLATDRHGETMEAPAPAMPSRAAAFDQTIVSQETAED
jgi:serine/threonine-protein kinase